MTSRDVSIIGRWRASGSRALVCIAASWLLAQAALPGQETSASLAGVVVEADRPAQPVRRALVTVSRLGSSVRLSEVADDHGRFAFARLRPGRYMVSASKGAYVTSTLGARQPGGAGTPLVLTADQHVRDVRLTLVRGGVLTGRITDIAGTPAANLLVTAAPTETATGVPPVIIGPPVDAGGPTALRTVVTDDRGVFRVHGLPPGDYLVAVTPVGVGRLALLPMTVEQARTARSSYGPMFYPGTPAADDAARIRVSAGEIVDGLDFSFDLVPTVAIEGTVVGPDGTPAEGVAISINGIGPPLPMQSALAGSAKAASGGQFRIPNVRPGRYLLYARSTPLGNTSAWAMTEIRVTGANITGLTLALQPAMSLYGRIVFEGATAAPPPTRVLLQRERSAFWEQAGGLLNLTDTGQLSLGNLPTSSMALSRPDGSFTVMGILPGRLVLSVSPPSTSGGGWWLKFAVAGGRDLLDMPLEFGGNVHDIKDAVLTLTNRQTELTGRLQTAAGHPATEYLVIVCSADRAHWFPGARRTRAVRPASDGTFSITQLPAGSYLIAAVTDAVSDEWQHAAFLEQLAPLSVPVTVPDGGTVRQDLQIAR